MERRYDERANPHRPSEQAKRAPPAAESPVKQVLGLQASAGNTAVASVLQRQPRSPTQERARRTYARAASAYEGGHYRRALELWERLASSPATTPEIMPDIVWNLAISHAQLGETDAAMTAAMTYGQYRPDEQQQLLDLIRRIQRDQARAAYGRAVSAYEQRRYRDALRLYERLTRSSATTPEIMPDLVWNIALAKAHLGDIDGAMTAAMTYGQYRPDEQQQLIERIHQIRSGR